MSPEYFDNIEIQSSVVLLTYMIAFLRIQLQIWSSVFSLCTFLNLLELKCKQQQSTMSDQLKIFQKSETIKR